ncbi:MAG: deoxyribonuclease I [Pseudomonadaceae bacterium]|nr:MAG: deoxyribonuclease I [Pseudomonadaceae bacterium]
MGAARVVDECSTVIRQVRGWLAQSGLVAFGLLLSAALAATPLSFEQAKTQGRQQVYFDRHTVGTFYCGCQWEWMGRSGGRVDLDSCGYQIRRQEVRAHRIEWEHVVPASNFGRARQCWQDGGRSNCKANDPVFNVMEADLHNLSPAIGEVNADRSNYRFAPIRGAAQTYGACAMQVDFQNRIAEPPDAVKGQIARIYFYMHDRYDLPMALRQQQILMSWDQQVPVSDWERERDRRIAAVMGHGNPFVSGERVWNIGYRNTADGVVSWLPEPAESQSEVSVIVRGNRNSKVYHLPQGCPSYNQISPQNVVEFASAAEAEAAGFRRAGNCR